jgi:hypothetical protein
MNERLMAQFSGPKDTIATCGFQTEVAISRLEFRDSPYWHHLLVGRHIGIHRPDGRHCNWTARILTRDRRYIQRCLGPALDMGRGLVSYLAAITQLLSGSKNGTREVRPLNEHLEAGQTISVSAPLATLTAWVMRCMTI